MCLFLVYQALEWLLLWTSGHSHADLCRWDCHWYGSIAKDGYDARPWRGPLEDGANWAFFPLVPLLARGLSQISGLGEAMSLVIVSKACWLGAIYAFLRLAQAFAPTVPAWIAGIVVVFNPYALYGNVGYTESAFLWFSCLFLVWARERRFEQAGLAGALLTATRPVGVACLIALPLLLGPRAAWRRDDALRVLTGCLLAPLGLAMFMAYLYHHTGDSLAFAHIQVHWGRVMLNPFAVLWNGLRDGDALTRYWGVLTLAALLAVAHFAWRREWALAAFSAVCTLLPLSSGLWAMPRFLAWQAPLLLCLARCLGGPRRALAGLVVGASGLAYLYLHWLPGQAEFVW